MAILPFDEWGEAMAEWGQTLGRSISERAAEKNTHQAGDVHAVEIGITHTYCLGVRVGSTEYYRSDLWIGQGRIAEEKLDRRIIVDLEENTWTYINHLNETFIQTSLPLDFDSVLSDYAEWRSRFRRMSGRVTQTDRTKSILNKFCREYEIVLWEVGGESGRNVQPSKVWSTTEVSFDLDPYYAFLRTLRLLFNRDARVREELEKIEGYQLVYEQRRKRFPFENVFRTMVVSIERETAPPGVYGIPEGYRRKSTLHPWEIKP
jgi:hypothetical protein